MPYRTGILFADERDLREELSGREQSQRLYCSDLFLGHDRLQGERHLEGSDIVGLLADQQPLLKHFFRRALPA